MIEKLKRLRAWLMSPVGKVFILGVGVSLVMLALGYRRQVYSSDDVVWQNALLTWVPFHKNIYYSDGSASFIAKVPLYLLIGKIIAPSRLALLVASAFLTAGNFALCYFIIIGFLKRAKVHLTLLTLLPFVWVASLGWQFETLFLMPNVHNIEVGFVLLMYAAAVKVAAREVDFRKSRRAVVWAAVLCLLFGLFILDDQYVLYFGVAPVVGLGIYLLARHRTKDSLIILGGSVLSVAFAHVFHLMAAMAGVQLPAGVPVSFASFPMFVSNIGTTVESLLMVFDADFWGRKVVGFTTVSMMLNAGILAIVVIAVGRTLRRSKILWLILLAGVFVFALAVYATSDLSIGTSTYRYLVLLPFIAIPFLSIQLEGGHSDLKRVLVGLLVASILLNVAVGIVGAHEDLASPPANQGNRQNSFGSSFEGTRLNQGICSVLGCKHQQLPVSWSGIGNTGVV